MLRCTSRLAAVLWVVGLSLIITGSALAARPGPRQPRLGDHPADPTLEAVGTFTFSSTESDVSFECALDRGAFAPCSSPFVTPALAGGDHEFAVRARAASGDRSAPSTFRWRVNTPFSAPSSDHVVRSARPPQPEPGGSGAFRIKCAFSHASYDDPIVFPNLPGRAHLHLYFGNRTADAASDALTLARLGDSTCHGGEMNRSAYWIPALLAPAAGHAQHAAEGWQMVLPADGYSAPDFYYKADITDQVTIQPMPAGLRMIAGSAAATAPQSNEIVRWSCRSWRIASAADFSATIPRCAVGDTVQFNLIFPSCWDGRSLYEADQSHMAYPVSERRGSGYVRRCPLSHPLALPQVSFHFLFPVTRANAPGGDSRDWRLASDHYTVNDRNPGGLTAHGDWMMGWNPDVMQAFVENCLRKGLNCSNGELGNGWRLDGVGRIAARPLPEVMNAGMGMGMSHAGHAPSAVTLSAGPTVLSAAIWLPTLAIILAVMTGAAWIGRPR